MARLDDAAREQYPQGCQILSGIPAFTGSAEMLRTVRRLVSDIACRSRTAETNRTEALRSHTLRDRLTALHEQLTTRPS